MSTCEFKAKSRGAPISSETARAKSPLRFSPRHNSFEQLKPLHARCLAAKGLERAFGRGDGQINIRFGTQ